MEFCCLKNELGDGNMSKEKGNEHSEHNHEHKEHHSSETYGKKDEKYKFEINKVRIWQGVSLILAIALVFLWFIPRDGSMQQAPVQLPTEQPSPTQQPSQQQPTRQNIAVDDDPVLGNKNAPVTIVEFSDFQCPYCGRFYTQTLPSIKKEYIDTGKVKIVYRDFPLSFHANAQPAAEATECADEQGKYWEYHDEIFKNQQSLSSDLYLKLAEDLGLDADKFKICIETNKYKEEVNADFNYGQNAGVSGTPTFFINGIKLVGAQPYEAFKQIIDAELAK